MITTNLDVTIEETKDNYDIVRVNKDGNWTYIGSKYNTQHDIDNFMSQINEEKDAVNKIFFVYGFGAGEHIKVLCDEFPNNRVIVFEPNETLGKYIVSLDWIENYRKLSVFCSDESELKNYIKEEFGDFKLDKIKFIYYANYNLIYLNEFSETMKIIKEELWQMQIQTNTCMAYSKTWFDTFIANFEFMIKGIPSTVYKDKYKGKPAIIVSAGPSLEKNINLLKKIDNDFLVFVGGRTLRSVMDIGVEPSAIVNIDPSERNYKLVEGYIENTNAPLVFYEGTNEKIVSEHKGKKIFFTQRKILKELSEMDIDNYTVGGSIAHVATAFAVDLGCSPIIFIGQDLAYTNKKMYSSITADKNNEKSQFQMRKDTILVDAVGGGVVETEPVLYGFKQEFERFIEFKRGNTVFINATEGGARIKGTIEMSLEEVMEIYGGDKIVPLNEIDVDYNVDIKGNAEKMIKTAITSAREIIINCEEALINIKKLKEAISKKSKKINKILSKLDKLDLKIKEEYNNLEITDSLIFPLVFDAVSNKYYTDLDNNLDDDNINRIIDNSERLYSSLLKNMKYALTLIENLSMKIGEKNKFEFMMDNYVLE